jgi:phage terminase large subunit-like protein
MAANQVGKTIAGGAEVAMHLTGEYPEWWPGIRYDAPVNWWASSVTGEATRDNPQAKLVGPPAREEEWGTGFIPKSRILDVVRGRGTANLLDTVTVRHKSGGVSSLGFKTYEQGREKWQGPTLHGVWYDEEPPMEIYMEGLTRTNAVANSRVILTFTPLLGMSDVVSMFLTDAR